MEENINLLIEKISSGHEEGKFLNYIHYIQFPRYKKMEDNARINFSFPLTMLVGKNGSGKSSVLHAIYGAPKSKSTGDYWFTTVVDPIEEGKNKYFYGYKKDKDSEIKEVLKKRQPSIKGPDYWESAALDTKIGMKEDNNTDSESRNDPVSKAVLYFDFRSELSAFDKYFHFYKSKPDRKQRKFERKNKDAKEYIKKQAPLLKRVFDGEKKVAYFNHPFDALHEELQIIDNKNGKEKLDAINYILGKDYSEIKLVYHRTYESWGTSVMVTTKNGTKYSEANAGSGENAVINLVCTILDTPRNALILLDEPEVSLHPSAQKKLKIFLLNMIKKNQHQIIISTHSIVLIEEMPRGSLKLFEENELGTTIISNDVYYKEAFFSIKEEAHGTNLIICEDSSAKILIDGMLNKLKIENFFSVEYRHGGADTLITKHLPILALDKMYDKVFIILDGDKQPEKIIKFSEIAVGLASNVSALEDNIKGLTTSNCLIKALIDGGKNGSNKQQKIEVYQEYLKYAENHLYFLPGKLIPEAIVLSNEFVKECYSIGDEEVINNQSAKQIILNICNKIFPDESCMDATMKMATKLWIENDDSYGYKNQLEEVLNSIYQYCNT